MFYGNRTALLLAKHSMGTPLLILKGPSGLGKSMVAKSLARKSLCVGTKGKNCNCDSCSKLKSGNHPDFFYVSLATVSEGKKDLEKSIKLLDIAFINKEIRTQPLASPYKVFLIDDANNMTNEAQTRLLKTIEDTPSYVKFLIVAHGSLLPTIMSRGIFINFSPLEEEEILDFICERTQDERMQEIIIASTCGSPGNAVRLADDAYTDFISEILDCILDNASASTLLNSAGLLKEKDADSIMNQSKLIISSSLMCLSNLFFDLIKIKMGSNKVLFESRLSQLNVLEKKYSLKGLNKIYSEIEKCLGECDNNSLTQERLIMLFDMIAKGEQLSITA